MPLSSSLDRFFTCVSLLSWPCSILQISDLPNFHPFFLPLRSTRRRRFPSPVRPASSSVVASSSSSLSSPASSSSLPPSSSSVYHTIPFIPRRTRQESPDLLKGREGAGERERRGTRRRRRRRRVVLPYGGGALRFRLVRAVERKKGTSAMLAVVREGQRKRARDTERRRKRFSMIHATMHVATCFPSISSYLQISCSLSLCLFPSLCAALLLFLCWLFPRSLSYLRSLSISRAFRGTSVLPASRRWEGM